MGCRTGLVLAAAVLLSVSANAEEAPPQDVSPETTLLLTRLRANEMLMLKSVRLRNRTTGEDVVIGRGSEPVLLEVEPGSYYLRRIDTGYFNIASMRIPEPELFFELQPGRVNYIGDLLIALFERPELNVQWDFAPFEDTLREAAALRPDAFRMQPLLLRPGAPPAPIAPEPPPPPAPATESD